MLCLVLEKMSNYIEKCLKKFVEMKATYHVQIRFEVYYSEIQVYFYYNDESYFNVHQAIKDLDNYLRQCNIHKLNWDTYAKIGIDNSTGANYSQLCFKRHLTHLTRLDIQKR